MKKILIFSAGSELYGSERGLLSLVEAIRDLYEITVVLPGRGSLAESLKEKGIRTFVFPLSILTFSWSPFYYLFTPFLFLLDMVFFTGYVLSKKIDLLYTNNLLLVFPSWVAAVARKRHIWHLREFFPSHGVNRMLVRMAQTTRSSTLCMSRNIRDVLFLPEERKTIPVIYEGITDPQAASSALSAEQPFFFPTDVTVFAVISRIHPSKGQFQLVKLMHEASSSVSRKAVLLILGDVPPGDLRGGAYKRKIERYVRDHHMERTVIFCGFRKDVPAILRHVDVCVFPFQRNEPFGLAFLEALVFSKRVLININPGSEEILSYFKKGHTGLSRDTIEREILGGKQPSAEPVIPEVFRFDSYRRRIRDFFREQE
jgi:glycosyltransferase involved in cell wall biosynthesis